MIQDKLHDLDCESGARMKVGDGTGTEAGEIIICQQHSQERSVLRQHREDSIDLIASKLACFSGLLD